MSILMRKKPIDNSVEEPRTLSERANLLANRTESILGEINPSSWGCEEAELAHSFTPEELATLPDTLASNIKTLSRAVLGTPTPIPAIRASQIGIRQGFREQAERSAWQGSSPPKPEPKLKAPPPDTPLGRAVNLAELSLRLLDQAHGQRVTPKKPARSAELVAAAEALTSDDLAVLPLSCVNFAAFLRSVALGGVGGNQDLAFAARQVLDCRGTP